MCDGGSLGSLLSAPLKLVAAQWHWCLRVLLVDFSLLPLGGGRNSIFFSQGFILKFEPASSGSLHVEIPVWDTKRWWEHQYRYLPEAASTIQNPCHDATMVSNQHSPHSKIENPGS